MRISEERKAQRIRIAEAEVEVTHAILNLTYEEAMVVLANIQRRLAGEMLVMNSDG